MRLKISALIAAAVMGCTAAFAAKPTVYVTEFDNTAGTQPGWVEIVRGAVLEGFHNTNRVTLVDAKTESARYEEELRRLKENLATDDLSTTEALKTRGSHAILSADVTSLTIPGTKLDSGTMSYEATVTFTLKAINASDGSMIGTQTFTLPKAIAGGILSGNILKSVCETEDAAVQAIKSDIAKAMKDFVDETFPIFGIVESVETVKKGKEVETFYIGLGSEDGLAKGTKLDIKIEQQVGKRKALKGIGECEVIEIAGDDISLCKVKKGGEEMKAAFDGEQTLVVTSKSKKK